RVRKPVQMKGSRHEEVGQQRKDDAVDLRQDQADQQVDRHIDQADDQPHHRVVEEALMHILIFDLSQIHIDRNPRHESERQQKSFYLCFHLSSISRTSSIIVSTIPCAVYTAAVLSTCSP